MIWSLFYSTSSSSEHGTLYQLRNLINRRNVVAKPMKDFNACDDFFITVLTGHIIAAAMKVLHIDSPSGIPEGALFNAGNLWMESKEERQSVIESISSEIVDSFNFQFKASSQVAEDGIQIYGKQLLGIGMLYWEYTDAIKEGDGDRLLRCWKYMLVLFINTGRKNYSIEALKMLYQFYYQLPQRQATQLLYSRFVNVFGLPGHNIPTDLHLEHLNAIVKSCVKSLRANKTEEAIKRSAKALGKLFPICQRFDEENNVAIPSGTHSRASIRKDLDIIVEEIQNLKIFDTVAGRKHPSFSHPKNALLQKSEDELKRWITVHI